LVGVGEERESGRPAQALFVEGEVQRAPQRCKLTVDSGGQVSSRKSRCLVTLDAVGGEINRAMFAERRAGGPDAPFEGRKRSAAGVAGVGFEAFPKFPHRESSLGRRGTPVNLGR